MARKLIPVFCLVAFLFLSAGFAFAEAVVVKGDKIFIADGVLSVLNIADGLTADCSIDPATVTGATDVVVTDDGTAVVTVGEAGSISVVTVDVSDCLEIAFDVDVDECVATIDLEEGVIDIPCLYYNGVVYDIDMEQRGNSDNWEVSLDITTNDDMSGYEHDDNDNGNDNDDNDNDDNDNDDNDNDDNDNDDNDNDDNDNDDNDNDDNDNDD